MPAIKDNVETIVQPLRDRIKELETKPFMKVWRPDHRYCKHDLVTHGGSLWAALSDSVGMCPGATPGAWQLAVKRSTDGKKRYMTRFKSIEDALDYCWQHYDDGERKAIFGPARTGAAHRVLGLRSCTRSRSTAHRWRSGAKTCVDRSRPGSIRGRRRSARGPVDRPQDQPACTLTHFRLRRGLTLSMRRGADP